MRRVFSTPGRPMRVTARASAARESTAAWRVVGMPRRSNRRFSARRSCAAASARNGGATRAFWPRSAWRSASTETFSQSKLITRQRRASSVSSAGSVNSPMSAGASCAAGVSALRSRKRKSSPSG
jgi:hypothetical protein